MVEVREGQYYYARHRNSWGVWRKNKAGDGDFITDFSTQIQAKNFVYKMNGYTLKKEEE